MPLSVVLIPLSITKFILQLSMVLVLPVLLLWIPAFVPDNLTKNKPGNSAQKLLWLQQTA